MTLWNIIRDFFVQYIFGGTLSTGEGVQSSFEWGLITIFNDNYDMEDVVNIDGLNDNLGIEVLYNQIPNYHSIMSLSDWLSTTATIITLCAICVFLFFFVRWLFRLTAGLVSGRG